MTLFEPPSTALKLINFVLFQVVWFAAVEGAAECLLLLGPAVAIAFACIHLRLVDRHERAREFGFLTGVTLLGALLDAGLAAIGATVYPTSGPGSPGSWPAVLSWLPPAWILSLWLAFACLPRFSLAWLRGRYALAAVLGALGGPLSYLGGVRLGAVALGESPALTLVALGVEYALAMPLILHRAPGLRARSGDAGASAAD
ncbi:MAG: DUF2878 domain-containing protein [Planctomycetota bacterium]|nr:DUF2878 domain-containing protein [Planctomycetota bacterium]